MQVPELAALIRSSTRNARWTRKEAPLPSTGHAAERPEDPIRPRHFQPVKAQSANSPACRDRDGIRSTDCAVGGACSIGNCQGFSATSTFYWRQGEHSSRWSQSESCYVPWSAACTCGGGPSENPTPQRDNRPCDVQSRSGDAAKPDRPPPGAGCVRDFDEEFAAKDLKEVVGMVSQRPCFRRLTTSIAFGRLCRCGVLKVLASILNRVCKLDDYPDLLGHSSIRN